jgi:hypothetical protein
VIFVTDYRAELQRLVQAYDEHGGKWPDAHEQALFQAVEAARTTLAQPEHPSDGGLTVSLRMDLSSECLKRLCDGLAAAVKPNGGYREITTDDDIASGFTGDQQVGVTWWLPEHGCDSLENTLDAIKGRLLVAVRNWLPTAVAATTTIKPVPVAERPWEREGWCDAEGRCWWLNPCGDVCGTVPSWVLDGIPAIKEIRFYGYTHSLPHDALPVPQP